MLLTPQNLNNQEVMSLEDRYLAGLYSKRPIAIKKGQGVYLWDNDDQRYLDLVGGQGVAILGHTHPKYIERVKAQLDDLIICPCVFYNEERARLGEKIAAITPSGLDTTFLSNSGTESIEAGLKLARKATGKHGVIAFKGAFHGRTFGSLAATWNPKYRKPFEPGLAGVTHVEYGNIDACRQAITPDIGTILVEPIQGETGVIIPPDDFLPALRELCDSKGLLLMCDEVQTGFGRTGKFFAVEHFGLKPDIICAAKGIAGGIPMGATISRADLFQKMEKGDHGSTFGGNALSCAAANATIDILREEKLVENSAKVGAYFLEKLKALSNKPTVSDIRGRGLMLAIQLKFKQTPYIKAALERHLLLLTSGLNIIRMLPPLILTKEHITEAINVLDQILDKEAVKNEPE